MCGAGMILNKSVRWGSEFKMNRVLFLSLALTTVGFATPPRVRVISVSEGSALIRVSNGAPEARILALVDSLNLAGITNFTFEANSDLLLNKLKSVWFDSGITKVTITKPSPRSSSTFPKLDPITARATLAGIDDELKRETARFETHRKALVDFVYHHGIPEANDRISPEDLARQKQKTEKQLAALLDSPLKTRLTLAAQVAITDNPVAKHLESHQKANQEKARLVTSGFGNKHPDIIATSQEIEATHQLAVDELGAIEEALRIQIYQLGKRTKHLKNWQQLSVAERRSREQSFEKLNAAYQDSLHRIQEIKATKNAAIRSLKE